MLPFFCSKVSDVKVFYHNGPGLFLEHWKASKIIVPHCDKKTWRQAIKHLLVTG